MGVFTGVKLMLVGDPGLEGYMSLRSVSVPYPLSTSAAFLGFGRKDFGGHNGSDAKADGVRGLLAVEESLDCAWRAVASSLHPCMIFRSTDKI